MRVVRIVGVEDAGDVLAAAVPANGATLGNRCVAVESDDDVAVARFEGGSEIEADVIIGCHRRC
jgi:salicylate hydroxylase